MKIFISSTYEDLINERKEAINTIDRIGQAIAMEKYFASNHKSKDVCLKKLQESDAMVLIIGFRYGSIDKSEGISITEIEYNTAKTLGLPVLVFMKQQLDGGWRSEETDEERFNKFLVFKARIDTEKYWTKFETPQQLSIEILGAIRQYEIDNGMIGVRLPAFISYEDLFRPFLDNTRLFNHVYPLVGRKDILEQLDSFVESGRKVALLPGRGGIGKSKILLEYSREFVKKHSEWKLRFTREGIALSEDSIRSLPAQNCVVIVDDAHRREDLSILFNLAQQYPDRIKIILACRPQGLDYIRAALNKGGFDPKEVEIIQEIKELGHGDIEELGRITLGKDHQRYLEPLIQVAKNSPLVLVIGGRLISEGAVDLSLLGSHDEFHRAVFDRFQDVLLGQVSNKIGTELCRDLLSLISALSPVKPQMKSFQEQASKFLNIERNKLIDAIGILESAGILLRRGYSLRISPDILSDHILYNACITPQGEQTGYAQKVFHTFGPIFPENVLFNLSELDWRVAREGKSLDLLGEIWEIIENEFKEAPHVQRSQILKLLERAAYFQPRRTLSLVQYAIQYPAKTSGGEEWISLYKYTHNDVLHAIPPLLKGIAFNVDYLPRCLDLLWHLGRDYERETNPYPDHAMRVLADLAKYDIDKPISVSFAVMDALERWLKEADAHEYIHSPLDILDPLLAKEGDSARSRGHSIVFRPFAISFETTKPIREKAILLLSDCTKSKSTKVVLRALDSLFKALNPPHGLFGREVSDEEINQWLPMQQKILEAIEHLVKNTDDPIIHLQIASDLKLHSRRNRQEAIVSKVDSIRKAIPDSFDLRITRALWYRYDRDWDGEDYEIHQERVKEEIKQTIAEILGHFKNGNQVFDFLNIFLSHFHNSGIQANPGYFLYLLSTNDPKLSIEICKNIISHSSFPLSTYLSSLLSGIREKSTTKATKLIKQAVKSKNQTLCLSIANGYAWSRWASSITDDEIRIIKKLLIYPDKDVKSKAIEALGRFPKEKRNDAIQLALAVNIEDDDKLADSLCGIFDPTYGIPPSEIKTEDLKAILYKSAGIKELDNHLYNLDEFLEYCSSKIPEAVVDYLLRRLEIAEEKPPSEDYQPFPILGFHHGLKDIASSSDYKYMLRKVRDRALNANTNICWWISKLFADLSDNFSSISIKVLCEWIDSNDSKKIQTLGLLVKNAPSEFVFSHSEFVSSLLEKAHKISLECYNDVASNLSSSATSGIWSRTPGKPSTKDIRLRDKSKELSQKFPMDSSAQQFYFSLLRHAEFSIRDSLARDEDILED